MSRRFAVLLLMSAVCLVGVVFSLRRARTHHAWRCLDIHQTSRGRVALLRTPTSSGEFMDFFGFSPSTNSWRLTTLDVESRGLFAGSISWRDGDVGKIRWGLDRYQMVWTNNQFEVLSSTVNPMRSTFLVIEPDTIQGIETAVAK